MRPIERAITGVQYSGHLTAEQCSSPGMALEQFYTVCNPALTQERDHA
ncbi:MAG: hypothetical protein ABL892_08640 [Thiobacillaceae bacterium]